jgi:hypothetical protein
MFSRQMNLEILDGTKILKHILTSQNPQSIELIRLLTKQDPKLFNLNSEIVNIRAGKQMPVFLFSILSGNFDLVKCVVECGADINIKFRWFPTQEETTVLGLSLYLGFEGIFVFFLLFIVILRYFDFTLCYFDFI